MDYIIQDLMDKAGDALMMLHSFLIVTKSSETTKPTNVSVSLLVLLEFPRLSVALSLINSFVPIEG